MTVYIIGFMGSGKSTAGKKLASLKGWKFIDLDSMIEEKEESSITELFERKGEEYFRMTEAECLREIGSSDGLVVACGGGTPCYHGNMDYMNNNGITVYLEMSPRALASRLSQAKHSRPLIAGLTDSDMESYISEALDERKEYYEKAKIKFDGLKGEIRSLAQDLQDYAP